MLYTVVVHLPSCAHELKHAGPPCPSPFPRVCPCPSSRWCLPTISSSVDPFSSHLQSFPASGSFPMSQFFASGGQSIGASASASVLPMSIQGWFPLRLTGLISLLPNGLSRVYTYIYICVYIYMYIHQLCPTLCDPVDCSTPGFPVYHQLMELAQTQVHRVGDAIQPSYPLSSPSPPVFNLSQHQGLFQWVSSLHHVAKVLEFQLQHQSFQWIFRTDFL